MRKTLCYPVRILFCKLGGITKIAREGGFNVDNLSSFGRRGYVTREHYFPFIDYLLNQGVELSEQQKRALLTNEWVGVSTDFKFTNEVTEHG